MRTRRTQGCAMNLNLMEQQPIKSFRSELNSSIPQSIDFEIQATPRMPAHCSIFPPFIVQRQETSLFNHIGTGCVFNIHFFWSSISIQSVIDPRETPPIPPILMVMLFLQQKMPFFATKNKCFCLRQKQMRFFSNKKVIFLGSQNPFSPRRYAGWGISTTSGA